MTRYAQNTVVSSDRSRAEVEKTLVRYGATAFMYGWGNDAAIVGFEMNDRRIKFVLPMPSRDEFSETPTGKQRHVDAVTAEFEKAIRQRWRALALVIKAKLEAVETGITEFDEEFLAHILLPDGQTVGEHALPMIAAHYETGDMPPLLPGPGA